MTYSENDGRFPEDSEVLVWYPGPGSIEQDRSTWAWLPGSVLEQVGPDEWHLAILAREICTLEDGTPAPAGTPDEDLYYPAVFRDSSEIKRQP